MSALAISIASIIGLTRKPAEQPPQTQQVQTVNTAEQPTVQKQDLHLWDVLPDTPHLRSNLLQHYIAQVEPSYQQAHDAYWTITQTINDMTKVNNHPQQAQRPQLLQEQKKARITLNDAERRYFTLKRLQVPYVGIEPSYQGYTVFDIVWDTCKKYGVNFELALGTLMAENRGRGSSFAHQLRIKKYDIASGKTYISEREINKFLELATSHTGTRGMFQLTGKTLKAYLRLDLLKQMKLYTAEQQNRATASGRNWEQEVKHNLNDIYRETKQNLTDDYIQAEFGIRNLQEASKRYAGFNDAEELSAADYNGGPFLNKAKKYHNKGYEETIDQLNTTDSSVFTDEKKEEMVQHAKRVGKYHDELKEHKKQFIENEERR